MSPSPPGGALIIEGGGMKAAYANGVLSAFEEAGHRPFAAVYGASAGGAMAAWFSAGQARYAESTWDYAADRRIVSYRRWLSRRGPLLDHDALLEIIYENEHPIDQDAIRQAPWPIWVSAVDVETGAAVYHDLRVGPIIPWLKATARLPFASGEPVVIDGRTYLDGGIADPIPVQRALADGAKRLTVILNAPAGPYKKDNPIVAELTARRYPALRHGLLWHQDIKRRAIADLEDLAQRMPVDIIRPSQPTGLHRLSRDLPAIKAAIEQGRRDGQHHLELVVDV